ncbi:sensor histidine kinase [Streptacidiphilus rugosus]|uniref:sensor histidine kinase n=1 Tax=Streptacidiphilus rugosus TaxID=405783 RepID=UPI0009FC0CDB|nr:sensor histidine kinase [Streptacidiphilus rugosus]
MATGRPLPGTAEADTGRGVSGTPVAVDGWLPGRGDALLAAGTAVLDVFGYTMSCLEDGRAVTAPALVLSVLAALPLLVRRTWPVAVLGVVLAFILTLNLWEPAPRHFPVAVVVALFSVSRHCTLRLAVPAGLTAGLTVLTSQGPHVGLTFGDVLGSLLGSALVVGAGAVIGRSQQEAEVRRALLADRAVAEERRRIARELHDIVAHHITTMQLLAGGARANLDGDVEVVREALVTLEGSGRLALREMRQLLDVLRADDEREETPGAPQPGTADLERIVDDARLGGMPTEFTVHGAVRPLPPTTELTIFRIVQEALTNARKHAGPARARVRLAYHPESVTVEVSDDGAGAAAPPSHGGAAARERAVPGQSVGGYGLIGMRERVALHGGTLTAGPVAGGGFRIAASLPHEPADARPFGAVEVGFA